MSEKTILIIGASGQTGQLLAARLQERIGKGRLVLATRRAEKAAEWQAEGYRSVVMDMDDPKSIAAALEGVNYLYLLTGYSVSMVTQSKIVVDLAVAAGVEFIVHQGVFGDGRSVVPHFAWHEMVESYIRGSGIRWCNLHPNYFMENLLSVLPVKNGNLDWYMADAPIGWIALDDLALAGAAVLSEGPTRHHGMDYFLSSAVMNGADVAGVLSNVLGKDVSCTPKQPEMMLEDLESGVLELSVEMEPNYASSGLVFMQMLANGKFPFVQRRVDGFRSLTGAPPTHFRDWVEAHSADLLEALQRR